MTSFYSVGIFVLAALLLPLFGVLFGGITPELTGRTSVASKVRLSDRLAEYCFKNIFYEVVKILT